MYRFYRLLARLPLPLLYGLSALAYLLVYHLARYRRDTVADNLAAAFPDRDSVDRRRLERRFYRHLCDIAAETFASLHMGPAQLRHRVTLLNPEVLQPFIDRRQSLFLLSSHQGNWEWLLRTLGDNLPCPMDVVYKPLHDLHMDRFIAESRGQSTNTIAFKDAGREMLRRRREFRAFSMLADQAPFKKDKRYWHSFLGRRASFYLGPQKIAEATQYPVFYVTMHRQRRGYYDVSFELLAAPPHPRDDADFSILARYVVAAERAIRAQPETWLWSNRKWKHRPPQDVAEQMS
jgi:KDO2-lipid IV(A) lauroyltransferase